MQLHEPKIKDIGAKKSPTYIYIWYSLAISREREFFFLNIITIANGTDFMQQFNKHQVNIKWCVF